MQRRQQIPHEYRSHTNFQEGWHTGGDAYTAVAVAKKTGTGGWVVYNIFSDHLGTITHLKNGSTIDEYSFNACDVKLRFCKPCETKPLAEHIPKSVAVRVCNP